MQKAHTAQLRAEPAITEAPPKHVQEQNPGMLGFVYFIQAEHGGPVKIGWAMDPAKRCRDLQTGSPHRLVVRATVPGSKRDESGLHRRFAADRVEGEWFLPTKALEQAAGCQLPRGHEPPRPIAKTKSAYALICDTCKQREAAFIDLRPWARWGCVAHLLCMADDCPDEGYWIPIAEWNDPAQNIDWRSHLVESKDGGHHCIRVIEERLKQKTKFTLRYAPEE